MMINGGVFGDFLAIDIQLNVADGGKDDERLCTCNIRRK